MCVCVFSETQIRFILSYLRQLTFFFFTTVYLRFFFLIVTISLSNDEKKKRKKRRGRRKYKIYSGLLFIQRSVTEFSESCFSIMIKARTYLQTRASKQIKNPTRQPSSRVRIHRFFSSPSFFFTLVHARLDALIGYAQPAVK